MVDARRCHAAERVGRDRTDDRGRTSDGRAVDRPPRAQRHTDPANGFFEEDSHDATLAHTVSSVNGHLHSAKAGGIIGVSTLVGAPIVKLDSDLYPSAGVLQAKGRNSTLRVTAVSAAAARLDLDADGNGSFEATETVNWDWLL